MLALARKVNESIIINDDIEVAILEIKGDQVKVGIKAPKSVPVYRKELPMPIFFLRKVIVCTRYTWRC